MTRPQNKARWTKPQKVAMGIVTAVLVFVIIGIAAGGSKESPKTPSRKQDATSLNATVQIATDIPGINVTNNEDVAWDNCTVKLNNSYSHSVDFAIEPHTTLNNPYSSMTKSDGTRFNSIKTQPQSVFVACNVGQDRRSGYFSF